MSNLLPNLDAIDALPLTALPAQLAQAAAVQARIAARLVAAAPTVVPVDDRLLTIDEAALALGKSVGWLYHQAKKLPFTRRVGRSVRFSSEGLRKYLDDQGA